MALKFAARRVQSIELIQETAIKLFADYGVEKTSIRMIATEAKIALGLLYNYFPSKADLLKSILLKFLQEQADVFNAEINQQSDVIEFIVKTKIKHVKQNRSLYKILNVIRLQADMAKELDNEIQLHNINIQKLIENAFAAADITFPALEAKLLLATLEGLTQQYLLQEHYPLDDLTHIMLIKYRTQKS